MNKLEHCRGECAALRILRTLVEGPESAVFQAIDQGKALLKSLRLAELQKQTGRPLSRVTPAQLRLIARLDGHGRLSQYEIAIHVGLPRRSVTWHLKPSAAMISALIGADQPQKKEDAA